MTVRTIARPRIEKLENRWLLSGFAPIAITGLAFEMHVAGSDFPFGQASTYRLVTTSQNAYAVQATTGSTAGSYTYTKTSDDIGIVQLNISGATYSETLQFTTAISGSYEIDSQDYLVPRPESGVFIVLGQEGTAPASIAGMQFINNILNGDDPFMNEGTYQFSPKSDGSYIIHGILYVSDSVGTYSYVRDGPQDAHLAFNDSLAGSGYTVNLHFTTKSAGTFQIETAYDPTFQVGVFALEGSSLPAGGSGGLSGGNTELSCSISSILPPTVVGNAKGSVSLNISDSGSGKLSGPVSMSLYISSDTTLDSSDKQVALTTKSFHLKPGASKATSLNFVFPVVPDGTYYAIAQVTYAGQSAVAVSGSTTAIASPFVDLTGMWSSPAPVFISTQRTTVLWSVQNLGNVSAIGTCQVVIGASLGAAGDPGEVQIGAVTQRVNIKPGGAKIVRMKVSMPISSTAGHYHLFATTNWTGAVADKNESNNLIELPVSVDIG